MSSGIQVTAIAVAGEPFTTDAVGWELSDSGALALWTTPMVNDTPRKPDIIMAPGVWKLIEVIGDGN